jgi:hypothetical protein
MPKTRTMTPAQFVAASRLTSHFAERGCSSHVKFSFRQHYALLSHGPAGWMIERSEIIHLAGLSISTKVAADLLRPMSPSSTPSHSGSELVVPG